MDHYIVCQPHCPLLFALAIKPLAQLIHDISNIRGLEVGGHHYKLCLFAGDVLLFMTFPLTSTPNHLKLLEDLGQIYTLKVNLIKTKALNISIPQLT